MSIIRHITLFSMWVPVILAIILTVGGSHAGPVVFKAGAYEGFTVTIENNVPAQMCESILKNLEETLTQTSSHLFHALDGRAFFRSINVKLPTLWPNSCVPGGVKVSHSAGERSDMTIQRRVAPGVGKVWTQQTAGCGLPGDQIYVGHTALEQENYDNVLGRVLVKEWAKYRYGVFDETGYINDPVYPMCYYNEDVKNYKVTSCSDLPVHDNGICERPNEPYNVSHVVDEKARASIMFAAEAATISMFCDDGNHNKFAPTKHNSLCGGRSTLDVILKHDDFVATNDTSDYNIKGIMETRPIFNYKRSGVTRYVVVIENSKNMNVRESWVFLRIAISKWALYDLPANTEVGMLLANDTSVAKLAAIRRLDKQDHRDQIASAIPFSPIDSSAPACLKCAIEKALTMLEDHSQVDPANSVILVIAPGMDYNMNMSLTARAKESNVRIATINYPDVIRSQSLDRLADATGGVSFTVYEERENNQHSLLSTYFKLTNVLYNVMSTYYEGSPSDIAVEIHRKEIQDDKRASVTGSFMLPSDMGEPARFSVYTHSSESPLIKQITLISPNHATNSTRSDRMLPVKLLTVKTNLNETGTWTYTIERFTGNPQPHYVQVYATPHSSDAEIVNTRFWTRRIERSGVIVLYCEVKYGSAPVLGAKVEAVVFKREYNGTTVRRQQFELLDTGSGDPDITKGDGVYTRYYNTAEFRQGIYTFEVTVTDNNNAYSTLESITSSEKPCCGSLIPTQKTPLSPFQRVLPPVTITVSAEDLYTNSLPPLGRIGDLRAEVFPEEQKAKLIWTAPDMSGSKVERYEIKYATTIEDISDKYETAAVPWSNGFPLPLAPGSETTFTIDISQERSLLDVPLYFALRSYSGLVANAQPGPVSNWVRVFIPSPPPPSTIPPIFESPDFSPSWPYQDQSEVQAVIPRIARRLDFGLELILPIVGGIALLAVLLAVYCYFCILKRRNGNHHKKPVKHSSDKMNSGITIVPQSPNGNSIHSSPTHNYMSNDAVDHHTVGLPVNYGIEEESKKRYSIVHQQEQQLIDELKQQQMNQQQRDLMQTPNNNHPNLSVISNNTLQRNGRVLSPFESWTASQLLHEHERRTSPLDEMMNQVHGVHDMNGSNADHMSINGQNIDHMSINGQDRISVNGQPMGNHMMAPPVPPLPTYSSNGYPVNYSIYGVHQNGHQTPNGHQNLYQAMHRNGTLVPFNPSLQGSLNSVNSGEKKRRNVTMV